MTWAWAWNVWIHLIHQELWLYMLIITLLSSTSGQHRLQHQDGHPEEHSTAHKELLWSGPDESPRPDEKGLLPPVLALRHLSAPHQEEGPRGPHESQEVTVLRVQRQRRGHQRSFGLVVRGNNTSDTVGLSWNRLLYSRESIKIIHRFTYFLFNQVDDRSSDSQEYIIWGIICFLAKSWYHPYVSRRHLKRRRCRFVCSSGGVQYIHSIRGSVHLDCVNDFSSYILPNLNENRVIGGSTGAEVASWRWQAPASCTAELS